MSVFTSIGSSQDRDRLRAIRWGPYVSVSAAANLVFGVSGLCPVRV